MLLAVLLLILGGSAPLFGQNASQDSVFRLLEAERAEQYEKYGVQYRLVKGHARFLHNDTYLLCDSASWNVDSRFIEAFGNVQIIQDKTMLKSEEMTYWIDESRALFRGTLVELFDKDGNTLRTERLSYNTKDSVAVFEYGGSMKDRDGNVIESRKGTYDGKEGLFMFEDQVELYMDSIEIKTNQLRYFNETERAHFGRNTYLWRDNGFLRADAGWYDRPTRLVYFTDHVFMFDPSYDAWADELYYHQQDGAVDLLRNAQVLDSTNKSVYLGDHMQYLPANDSLSQRGLLTGNPAIIYYGENEDHVVDTLFARADSFYVYTVPRYAIPMNEVKDAETRLEDMLFDALSKKRTEEGAKREEERIAKLRAVGKLPPEWLEQQQQAERDSLARLDSLAKLPGIPGQARNDEGDGPQSMVDSVGVQSVVDSVGVPSMVDSVGVQLIVDSVGVPSIVDSVRVQPMVDSLGVMPVVDTTVMPGLTRHLDSTNVAVQDTVAVRDTTPIRYVHAWNNVKMYRSDIQAACDSMVFCELDSIARLFGRPILWNEVRNQLTAEDMQLLFRNGNFDRGSMITDAWIISEQDSIHYNQIKSTEMLGWFRDNKIYRFDALGGVTAIFYMVDEDVVTTINLKEAKSMTAALKDGTAQRLLYMETIKSDAYPVGDLEMSKQRLKGFEWRADERPVRREAITERQVRTSERSKYEGLKKPLYRQTNKFFDGYMYELFEQINARRRAELERRERERDSLARAAALDSLAALEEIPDQVRNDGMVRNDGVLRHDDEEDVQPMVDSVGIQPMVDTIGVKPDTTVMPGLTRHLDSTVVAVTDTSDARSVPGMTKNVVVDDGHRTEPVIDREKPAEAVDVASPETVVRSEQLTRAEKRALRKAERKARKEARRAARLARRQARAAARAAAREARSRK